jgi:hypothetical protein
MSDEKRAQQVILGPGTHIHNSMDPPDQFHWRWYHPVVLFLSAVCGLVGFASLFANDPKTEPIFINWLVPASVGLPFTLVGALKLYGLWKGIEGGAGKPFATRLCGS